MAMFLFEKGDFLFSFDLKSGYHHIDINEAHFKCLFYLYKGSPYPCPLLEVSRPQGCSILTVTLIKKFPLRRSSICVVAAHYAVYFKRTRSSVLSP